MKSSRRALKAMELSASSLPAVLTPVRTARRRPARPGLRALGLALILIASLGAGCSQEARLERHLARAQKQYEAGDFASALVEYANVLKLQPGNGDAIRQMGNCLFFTGDFRQAIPYLKATVDQEPANTDVRVKLGTLLLGAGQRDMARELAMQAVATSPTDMDSLVLLAESSQGTNAMAEALGILTAGEADLRHRPIYHLVIGGLRLRAGDLDAAEAAFQAALTLDGNMPEVHMAFANLHMAKGAPELAQKALEEAARHAPPDSRASLSLAEFLMQRDDLAGARRVLEAALAAAPDAQPPNFLMARLAYMEADYDTCLRLAAKILTRQPDSFGTLLLKANAIRAKGDIPGAIKEYEKLAANHPQIPRVRYDLARALLQARERPRAISELEQGNRMAPEDASIAQLLAQEYFRDGNFTGAISLLEPLARRPPMNPTVYGLLGSSYAAANRIPEALVLLRALREARPEDVDVISLLGRVQRHGNDLAGAATSYDEALRLNPAFLPALTERVLIYMIEDDAPAALALIQGQIERQPEQAALYELLGRAHLVGRDLPQAEKAFEQAITLDPTSAGAYILLGRIYSNTGRVPEALVRLEAALATDANNAAAGIMAAGLYVQQDEVAKAVAIYERLLERNPNLVPAMNNLAYLYADRLNRLDDAHKLAQRTRALMPHDPFIADTLGWILYRMGDARRAEPLLRESQGQLPDEPEVLYHLGMVQTSLGKETAALKSLRRATADTAAYSGKTNAMLMVEILSINPQAPMDAASLAKLEATLKAEPSHPAALLRMAAADEQAQQFAQAEARYTAILKAHPLHAGALTRLTRLYLDNLKAPDKAQALAQRYRAQAPDDPEGLYLQGLAATGAGDHKWALSLFRDGVKLAPDHAGLQLSLGQTAYQNGFLREATQAIERALQLDPNLPMADRGRSLLALVKIYRDRDTTPEAQALVQAALQEQPDALAARMAASAQMAASGNATDTRKACEGIVADWPLFAPALADLATLLAADAGTQDRAWELATKARELLPQDPTVGALVGSLASQRGQHAWAVSLLTEAIAQGVTNASTYYHLGVSEIEKGEKQAGKGHLETALQRADATFPHAAAARQLLERLSENP